MTGRLKEVRHQLDEQLELVAGRQWPVDWLMGCIESAWQSAVRDVGEEGARQDFRTVFNAVLEAIEAVEGGGA